MNEKKIRIMLVDDQPLVRQGLLSLLSLEDDLEIVGEATHGAEAITLFETLQPDVTLMDVQMPGVNGVDATQEIMTRHPDARILVLTTFDDDEFIVKALHAGAAGYLLKDTKADDIAGAIRLIHSGHVQLGPSIAPKVLARLKPYMGKRDVEAIKFMSHRELEILKLISTGHNNKEIASQLAITEGTVKNHISSILTQLGVRDRTQAALWASQHLN